MSNSIRNKQVQQNRPPIAETESRSIYGDTDYVRDPNRGATARQHHKPFIVLHEEKSYTDNQSRRKDSSYKLLDEPTQVRYKVRSFEDGYALVIIGNDNILS